MQLSICNFTFHKRNYLNIIRRSTTTRDIRTIYKVALMLLSIYKFVCPPCSFNHCLWVIRKAREWCGLWCHTLHTEFCENQSSHLIVTDLEHGDIFPQDGTLYCNMYAVEWTLLGNVQAPGLRVPVSLVMARQPEPKALSSLQSDQRSYTSERVSEFQSSCSWYPGSCWKKKELMATESRRVL
jgi:hypothetical protein